MMTETVKLGAVDQADQDKSTAARGRSWISKDVYTSREFAELEAKYLWPRTWQIACREEELPEVGSYVTYEILDESVIMMRTSQNEIKAYNNACLHRGRRLTAGDGRADKLECPFHGWTWNIEGACTKVVDIEDWGGALNCKNLALHEYKVGLWGGFVFINFDENCESFEEYLGEVPQFLGPLELHTWRYRWYISLEVDANWKTVMEAFLEAYHVQMTHKRLEAHIDPLMSALPSGKHGRLQRPLHAPQIGRYGTGGETFEDQRRSFLENLRVNIRDTHSITTDRDYQAACRILQELPPTATWLEAADKAFQFIREAAIASGAGFPNATREELYRAGADWNVFPNTANVLTATGGIWYRYRPVPDNDPNRCIYDIWSLERFSPGSEPVIKKQVYKDWRECDVIPPLLMEDFSNLSDVQRGMRTKNFRGALMNPKQEQVLINFHRALKVFIEEGRAAEAARA